MEPLNREEYITTSILETAFLAYKGFKYKVHSGKHKVYFVFQNIDNIIDDLIKEFTQGSNESRLLREMTTAQRIVRFELKRAYLNKVKNKAYEGNRGSGAGESEGRGSDNGGGQGGGSTPNEDRGVGSEAGR